MAIIISIIMAATRGVPKRGMWVLIGAGGGVAGAAIIALFAGKISNAMDGLGQEIFNAGVLCAAVLMIIWTVIWMEKHGKQIAQKMKNIGKSVASGDTPLYSMAIVVSLAMWREGAEIVLFMTGIINTSQDSIFSIMSGAVVGTAMAAVIGFMIYFGLIKLSTKYLFSITGWLLIFLACGMSAKMASYLNAADILPAFGQLWDSGWLLSQDSTIGGIMHAMLGYSERPSGIQLMFYAATMILTLALIKITRKEKV